MSFKGTEGWNPPLVPLSAKEAHHCHVVVLQAWGNARAQWRASRQFRCYRRPSAATQATDGS